MKFKISPQQVQKPILAPSMQQSIEVLLLPITELDQAIEQELQNNPLLEVDESKPSSDKFKIEELVNLSIKRVTEANHQNEESVGDYYNHEDDEIDAFPISRAPGLEVVLLEQLNMEISDPEENKIGEHIIGNLNEDGYLTVSVEEIASVFPATPVSFIERVLQKVQSFEPLGIASRNLQECLITQLKHLNLDGANNMILTVLQQHLDLLGRKKFAEIAKNMKISEDKVREIAQIISKLEPKPARKYRPMDGNIYVKPDVSIVKDEDGSFQVVVNRENIPYLRINPIYQRMLKSPHRSIEDLEFIKEKIKNALLFIRSIEQRHETLKEIAKYILSHQNEFWEQGHAFLKPMVLKDVAQAIDRNESTVSRAINNKFIETPQGMFAFKYFFSQALSQENNENFSVATRSIKEELKLIVKREDKSRPLSDHDIQRLFKHRGMNIARRTISKYRQALHILPSHLRKH